MNEKYTILIVCTGNTCRSPMAEGALRVLLEKERPGKFVVKSAGTSAVVGASATDYSIEAAKIWDADISDHESQQLTQELVDEADLILTMTPKHLSIVRDLITDSQEKSFLLKKFPDSDPEGESVDDPIGQSLDRYNETFLEIGEYLGSYLKEIIRRIDAKPVPR